MTFLRAFLNRFMKKNICFLLILIQTFYSSSFAQNKVENIIIITTDGFRWQEVFGGMDSSIARDKAFNEGKEKSIFNKYWADNVEDRRKLLLPFFWSVLSNQGQLYGNRLKGSFVDVKNPFWFSYPGYSEIFCGFVDTAINSNNYKNNPNVNVLEFINQQKGFEGKVAAFGAWDAFDRILNEERSGFPVVSAFDSVGGKYPNDREKLMNQMLRDSYKPWGTAECLDVFTHYAAMEKLKKDQPRVLYISYGETDEWAHAGEYDTYLNAGHQFDKWIQDIWNFVQSQPQYKNKTALLITTDHGRGDVVKKDWTDHGSDVVGANEIWIAMIGPGIEGKGEIINGPQLYQQQIAQTIASLLGLHFKANHSVAEGIRY